MARLPSWRSLQSRRVRVEQPKADVLVGEFAAAEPQGDLDLVAFFEEAAHGPHFNVVIVIVDARAQLDLFDFDDLLPLARFGGFLLFKKSELAVIEKFANRRIGVGTNLDEV